MPGTSGGDVVHFTLSFWLALPLSAALAAVCGILFGAPTLRLRGDYLAIVTLGFGEIVPIVVRNWTGLTNGAAGLNGVAPPSIGSFNFGVDATPYYYVALALVAGSSSSAPACGTAASAAPGWRSARTRSPPERWAWTWCASSCSPSP